MQTDIGHAQVNAGDLIEILDMGIAVQNVEFRPEHVMPGIKADLAAIGITGLEREIWSIEPLEDTRAPHRRQRIGEVAAELAGHIPLSRHRRRQSGQQQQQQE